MMQLRCTDQFQVTRTRYIPAEACHVTVTERAAAISLAICAWKFLVGRRPCDANSRNVIVYMQSKINYYSAAVHAWWVCTYPQRRCRVAQAGATSYEHGLVSV
jgi:hypothetical protein